MKSLLAGHIMLIDVGLRHNQQLGKSVAHLRIYLLGSFQVTIDGEPAKGFDSDKVRALLAYLASEADRPHRIKYRQLTRD